MPKDWGEQPSCAPRTERLPEEPSIDIADDGVCRACDGTGELHSHLCKDCGGKGSV